MGTFLLWFFAGVGVARSGVLAAVVSWQTLGLLALGVVGLCVWDCIDLADARRKKAEHDRWVAEAIAQHNGRKRRRR